MQACVRDDNSDRHTWRQIIRNPAHGEGFVVQAALCVPEGQLFGVLHVGELCPPAAVDEHVLGLEVAVGDAVGVQVGEACGWSGGVILKGVAKRCKNGG